MSLKRYTSENAAAAGAKSQGDDEDMRGVDCCSALEITPGEYCGVVRSSDPIARIPGSRLHQSSLRVVI